MRIATLIIALVLMVLLGAQSCVLFVGAEILGEEETAQGGAVGILCALLFLVGAAFVLYRPIVSVIVFALAGVLALAAGAMTDFGDLTIWGIVALVLGVMSYGGRREVPRNKKRRSPGE